MTKDETIQELASQLARKSKSLRQVKRGLNGALDTHVELKKKLGQAHTDKQASSNEYGQERVAKLELEKHCRFLEDEIERMRSDTMHLINRIWDENGWPSSELVGLNQALGIVK
jgi:predicted house-cleaning noncanonical NTP pyrophosphatase (MazG superfamily)